MRVGVWSFYDSGLFNDGGATVIGSTYIGKPFVPFDFSRDPQSIAITLGTNGTAQTKIVRLSVRLSAIRVAAPP